MSNKNPTNVSEVQEKIALARKSIKKKKDSRWRVVRFFHKRDITLNKVKFKIKKILKNIFLNKLMLKLYDCGFGIFCFWTILSLLLSNFSWLLFLPALGIYFIYKEVISDIIAMIVISRR